MIKFFKNTRITLLAEGKTSKYFKYAIGEIVLVVIGILIALQINNWNEQRQENIKEKQIVKSLYDEFAENSDYIEERLQHLSYLSEKSSKRLLALCIENHTDISEDSLVTLLYNTFLAIPSYAPKVSTFKRIINNEEYNLIQHDSLKALMNQYQPILDFTYFTNNFLQVDEQGFWAYARDKFGGIALGLKSVTPIHKRLFDSIPHPKAFFNPNDIISDIAFQNILTNHILYFGYTINRLNELLEQNKTIRDYIDKHYEF